MSQREYCPLAPVCIVPHTPLPIKPAGACAFAWDRGENYRLFRCAFLEMGEYRMYNMMIKTSKEIIAG